MSTTLSERCALAAVALACLLAPCPANAADGGFDYYMVESLDDGRASVVKYHAASTGRTSVSPSGAVVLWERAPEQQRRLGQTQINSPGALDRYLVSHGLARLADENSADQALRDDQAEAKAGRLGMWASLPTVSPPPIASTSLEPSRAPPNAPPVRRSSGAWKMALSWLYKVAAFLAGAGLLTVFLRYLHKRFIVRRRVRLSVIGLKGSGKTSVLRRFENPQISEVEIRKISPTIGTATDVLRHPVPMGKFEVHAVLEDTHGDNWGGFLRSVIGKGNFGQNVVLLTLAPMAGNPTTPQVWQDPVYINQQIGLAQALIGGCLDTGAGAKPSLIIIFLNKFDLVSAHDVNDSAGAQFEAVFKAAFDDFLKLKVINEHVRKTPLPIVRIVVGSAAKGWGAGAVRQAIEDALYVK